MKKGLLRNQNQSIINLFQKMDSNVSKFKASQVSSPTPVTKSNKYSKIQDDECDCQKIKRQRQQQFIFYNNQHEVVKNASIVLRNEGNEIFSKLLQFMSQYLLKISNHLKQQILCNCIKRTISLFEEQEYKINFLRQQNHKFFKIVQQKTFQNEKYKIMIEQLTKMEHNKINNDKPQFQGQSISQYTTSRIVSSNSSRISDGRQSWPQQTLIIGGQGCRRNYFDSRPGEHHSNLILSDVLKQKDVNKSLKSTFRKAKIFGLQ